MQLLNQIPRALPLRHLPRLLHAPRNQPHFIPHLLLARVVVNPCDHPLRLLEFPVKHQLPRRLRAEGQQAREDDGGQPAEPDHVAPAVRHVREGRADAVRDDLPARDGHVVQPDHAAAELGGGDFGDVHGDLVVCRG